MSDRVGSDIAESLGAELYARHCAACHGTEGEGVDERGPALLADGRAAVDFVLRTGRMPLAAPNLQPRRSRVSFTEEQIEALVDYAGAFGTGPDVPAVDATGGDLSNGGALYRLNCAACHVASGSGAAIGGGWEAPSLMSSSPTDVGEAILVGPGAMPVFGSFSSRDIDDVAAYIGDLQARDSTSPEELGGSGPVGEGLAAWLLGLLPLVALTRWLGKAQEGRDVPVDEGPSP
jgi:ubiquinol-cytochrome c reductase cytochrome c subunit